MVIFGECYHITVRIHGESSKTNPSVHLENKTDPDIINLTFHADVVISTSKSEGMSGSLLHAMCLAKPIISADIPANRELLAEGDGFLENHCLFQNETTAKNRILEVLNSESLRNEVGSRLNSRYNHRHRYEDEKHLYSKALTN